MNKVLVIDSERHIRNTLKEWLGFEGYTVCVAEGVPEGAALHDKEPFDVVLCELKQYIVHENEEIERIKYDTPVIILSNDGAIETVVFAMRDGAYDYLTKPIDMNRLRESLLHATEHKRALYNTPPANGPATASHAVKASRKKSGRVGEIVGDSKPIGHVKDLIERVAPSEARVLITGPNGTGKELVARWIHEKSPRFNGPFVEVNCAAIPSELIESELFGHERGAFTSAVKQRKGKFEQANGGTLFLDEIGDMSLSAQSKVLRALQESRISRVGSDADIDVNVRILTATNRDLYEEIQRGNFREDLYHRLSVILIKVPALKDRIDDVPLLVEHFLNMVCDEYNIPKKRIEPEGVKLLQKMPWTGNIRELRNVIERLVILSDRTITADDVNTYALGVL